MKFCFVVLHYLGIEDTKECINSILNNVEYESYKIIVVDNCSPNNTGEVLKQLYKSESKIDVVLNSKNDGYAKGNNLGGIHSIKLYAPDFICVLNNDTIIEQRDFIQIIENQYDEDSFHLLGPDILSNAHSQNPFRETVLNQKMANKVIKQTKFLLLLNNLYIDKFLLIYVDLKQYFKKSKKKEKKLTKQKNVGLRGSCLIFSKDYFLSYPTLFYEKTFLFNEENILSYIRKRDNLTSVFLPSLKVFHKEGASLSILYKKGRIKRKYYYKFRIQSTISFVELIKDPMLFSKKSNKTL